MEKEEGNLYQVISNPLKPCPNCGKACKKDSKYCLKCKIVISYVSYSEIRNDDRNKIRRLEQDIGSLKQERTRSFCLSKK
jgi:transcription initiation factor IIE alpha subunit